MFEAIKPTPEEMAFICELVRNNLGFRFTEKKMPLVVSRLSRRLWKLGCFNYSQYLERVLNDPDEATVFFNMVTTNVTQFFREAHQFNYLVHEVFPTLKRQIGRDEVRAWSAGCSSGEEPYSIAILCSKNLPETWKTKILASDVNTEALQTGMDGIYTEEQVRKLPGADLINYFQASGEGRYRVKEAIRKMVFFKQINLFNTFVLPERIKLDFIFCRNVFIYFDRETQSRTVNHFYRHLNPGGYLFLGHAETIDTYQNSEWRFIKDSIYQKVI